MKNIITFFSILFLVTGTSACSGDGENNGNAGSEKPISVFKGKNLVTFGNSITESQNSWAYQTSWRLEFGNLYNGAVGGAIWYARKRTSGGYNIQTQDYTDPDFAGMSNEQNTSIEAFQRIINNCAIVHVQKYLVERGSRVPDVIILSYGTNDMFDDVSIGNVAATLAQNDRTKLDKLAMAGALKWCLATLQAEFPTAKMYVALPLQAESDTKNEGNIKKIAAIKQICDAMSVPWFDCYNECGITKENSGKYLRDGLHPNEEGKTVHANYIVRKLKEANKQ